MIRLVRLLLGRSFLPPCIRGSRLYGNQGCLGIAYNKHRLVSVCFLVLALCRAAILAIVLMIELLLVILEA